MTTLVKVQKKGQLTIPNEMRNIIGLADGGYVQVVLKGRKIILEPAQIVTRTAAEELTPAQRRTVDARLAEGLADVKAGRVHGPFGTHGEMMAFLNKESTPRKRTIPRKKLSHKDR
ncbi:MAG TPA: AbrB/MazE/SpoVT family DNA-binding domain-containing protein [Bryobacteraceae bacterium]|nr:AbrB/MazE/SpoVT family DNA-binding domain-containing protein [Bryobacteraceae bacterium]